MFLLALGPTATVMAVDLSEIGYRAIDIGHLDIEYEWYLEKAVEKVKIRNKYTNESDDVINEETDNLKDKVYNEQIIKYIK